MENKQPKVPAAAGQSERTSSEAHMKNFLHCIKSREDPNCTVENGKLVAPYAHMGNIAQRTHSRLTWDEENKKFLKNKEANKLIYPDYRKPWSLPKL